VGYVVSDLIGDASEGNTCPVPKCRFLAHDPSMQKNDDSSFRGVTAIACGGVGQVTSSSTSTILLTGGADGLIKQYQMIRQNYSSDQDKSWNLAYWPRLPTQRMKDCAHLLGGHYGAVTALVHDGAEGLSKILSASSDGTIRVWDPAKGENLYRMDGFEGITSLCHDREILVTNGMNEFVCVHDFDVAEDIADSSYDLNW
jgi:WD40 repeat protein